MLKELKGFQRAGDTEAATCLGVAWSGCGDIFVMVRLEDL